MRANSASVTLLDVDYVSGRAGRLGKPGPHHGLTLKRLVTETTSKGVEAFCKRACQSSSMVAKVITVAALDCVRTYR